MQTKMKKSVLCLTLATALSGCATTGDGGGGPDSALTSALIGGLIGGTVGGLVCNEDDKEKCIIGGAVVGGAAGYFLSKRQQRIQAAAEAEGVNVDVIEYTNQDGSKGADLELEYDWYKSSDSPELSASGKEKLNRIISAEKEAGETEPLSMEVGYPRDNIVAKFLAEQRARNWKRHLQENNLGDTDVNILEYENLPEDGASRIVVR